MLIEFFFVFGLNAYVKLYLAHEYKNVLNNNPIPVPIAAPDAYISLSIIEPNAADLTLKVQTKLIKKPTMIDPK
jgi:hypothetical protein